MQSLVKDLMTTPVAPEATAAEAARRMHTAGVKRLPVVDRVGRLVGIVSRSDLLKVFDRSDQDIRVCPVRLSGPGGSARGTPTRPRAAP